MKSDAIKVLLVDDHEVVRTGYRRLRAHVLETPPLAVSSTMVREAVRRGRPIDAYVPASVATYVERNGLYR